MNPGTPGTKLKVFRDNLKIQFHPICNWLHVYSCERGPRCKQHPWAGTCMGWLRLVGSIKLQVFFAEYRIKLQVSFAEYRISRARALSLCTYVYSSELGPRCMRHPWAGTGTYIRITRSRARALSIHTCIRVSRTEVQATSMSRDLFKYIHISRARALSIHTCIRVPRTEVQATSMRRDVYTYVRISHACSLCIHMCIRVNSNRGVSNIHEQGRVHIYTYRTRAHTHTLSLYIRLSVWIWTEVYAASMSRDVNIHTHIARARARTHTHTVYTYVYPCGFGPRCMRRPWAGTWTYIHISRARAHIHIHSLYTYVYPCEFGPRCMRRPWAGTWFWLRSSLSWKSSRSPLSLLLLHIDTYNTHVLHIDTYNTHVLHIDTYIHTAHTYA